MAPKWSEERGETNDDSTHACIPLLLSMPVDDEVSIVLQNFRPQPEFLSSSKKRQRGFSFVLYKDHALKLCYLYNGIIPLHFQVSCNEPFTVCCELDSLSRTLQNTLQDICTILNQDARSSLFSVVSRLLLSLNKLSTDIGVSPMYTFECIKNLDLLLFLMRCAAASRNQSATLCTPIPHYDCIVHDPGGIVLTVTNRLDSFKIQRNLQPCSHQEQLLLAFLSALPWASESTSTTVSTIKGDKATKINVCINVDVGDETPYFTRQRKERGVIRAFHGTHFEAVWSILNHGLLYNKSLKKHGSMMGEGVYLSTSYNVAYFFATSNSKPLNPKVWQHSCFWKLTNMTRKPNDDNNYRVSCYAVVEANILLPPDSPKGDSTRRDGKYYVVPNQRDIHMTKIHLTLEIEKQWSISSTFLFVALAILMAVYLSLE
jgi:hypothetical protein